MYRLEDVRKVFDGEVSAVDGVDLVVAPGETVAVIGPSGAGKTTLFRMLNLTVRPSSGRLWIAGEDAAALPRGRLRELRRRIGTIYQQHNLVGRLRVAHNVLAGLLGGWSALRALRSLFGPRPVDLRAAQEALAQVGIPEKLWARTDELSGGQQQRVAIARVLLQDPQVILADEPVSSVDPTLAQGIVRLLVALCRERRKTLIMNLHSVDLALAHFPRIVGFREGRVAFDRPAGDVSETLLAALYAGARPDLPEDLPHAIPAVRSCTPVLRPQ
ncbi:MAG: phosphonate ABC transporter ATP-binding protein [Candidatus Methylomirabilales bacterium]